MDQILDIREYDVTYYVRASIDLGMRVGLWYSVTVRTEKKKKKRRSNRFAFSGVLHSSKANSKKKKKTLLRKFALALCV